MFQLTRRRPVAQIVSLVALLAALMLVLTACSGGGGGKEAKVTYTSEREGMVSTMDIYSEGENVTKQVISSVITYKDAGVKDKKDAEKQFSDIGKEYDGIKGITHKIKYGEKEATESLTVDYKAADPKKIAELTGVEYDKSKGSKVSLKETIEFVEQSGYTKKE